MISLTLMPFIIKIKTIIISIFINFSQRTKLKSANLSKAIELKLSSATNQRFSTKVKVNFIHIINGRSVSELIL